MNTSWVTDIVIIQQGVISTMDMATLSRHHVCYPWWKSTPLLSNLFNSTDRGKTTSTLSRHHVVTHDTNSHPLYEFGIIQQGSFYYGHGKKTPTLLSIMFVTHDRNIQGSNMKFSAARSWNKIQWLDLKIGQGTRIVVAGNGRLIDMVYWTVNV